MGNELKFESATISALPPRSWGPPEEGKTQLRLDVAIRVTNESTHDHWVIRTANALDYDVKTQTLYLDLSDNPGDYESPPQDVILPSVERIPHGVGVIHVEIPGVIKRIREASKLGLSYDRIDLHPRAIHHVLASIAYSDEPLGATGVSSPKAMLEVLRSWAIREIEVQVSLPAEAA